MEYEHTENSYVWHVRPGRLTLICARRPIFLGTLAGCALILMLLMPFALMESTADGRIFPLHLSAVMLAVSWGVVIVSSTVHDCLRGPYEIMYELTDTALLVTERGKLECKGTLPLADMRIVGAARSGVWLRCGNKRAYVLCGEREHKLLTDALARKCT